MKEKEVFRIMKFLRSNKLIMVYLLSLIFTTTFTSPVLASSAETADETEEVEDSYTTAPVAGVSKLLMNSLNDISSATVENESVYQVGSYQDESTNDNEEEEKEVEENTYEVNDTSYTMYVTSLINVRSDPNTDSEILGTLSIKTEVSVTGEVVDENWVRINYNDSEAYICSDYITDSIASVEANTYNYTWTGETLNSYNGIVDGPSGHETYYNLSMQGVIRIMQEAGYDYEYWVRSDGVKMYGEYVMVAADLSIHPRGSLVETSLGTGIVCDTGDFIYYDSTRLDIAVTW